MTELNSPVWKEDCFREKMARFSTNRWQVFNKHDGEFIAHQVFSSTLHFLDLNLAFEQLMFIINMIMSVMGKF